MKLLIVESPSKAKTIERYLGKDYKVLSSLGHIRDLPKNDKNAIDIENNFKPNYVLTPGKEKIIQTIVKHLKNSDELILATDPDREGEAIAWHIQEVLKERISTLPPVRRVRFYEITEKEISRAIQKGSGIDLNLKKAQEARRVLDRIFGYRLSELLWKKVRYGLSAGRVQSPALRILMEREREIRSFVPTNYYLLEIDFLKQDKKEIFTFYCNKTFSNTDELIPILERAEKTQWFVHEIQENKSKRNPKAPFTTSTLQQTASTQLGFSPSKTMKVAQNLYQKGFITYMRTDSTRLSDEILKEIEIYVKKKYGDEYSEKKNYQTKSKNAQEAHEAIRPTKIDNSLYGESEDERKLYELIKKRTIASQMSPAVFLKKKVIVKSEDKKLPELFLNGIELLFPGWILVNPDARGDDILLPSFIKGEKLKIHDIRSIEKSTTPPNRYTEAGLIKELEKRGIGRPSTYASILQTLIERSYVVREGRTLFPTDTGDIVSSFLEKHFAKYIADNFTASMEDDLDKIAQGEKKYEEVLSTFYFPFIKTIKEKEKIEKLTTLGKAKGFHCPKCGAEMVYKLGKTGKFISCSRYPKCDGALDLEGREIGEGKIIGKDPKTGEIIYLKKGPYGFYIQRGEDIKMPKRTTFPKGYKKTEKEKELLKKEREEIKRLKALPKPKRVSVPKEIKEEEINLELALKLLSLPRELGIHPESGEVIIANIGRFGPYVGHGKEFRSIQKKTGLSPYTITYEEALKILKEPKKLPKGVKLIRTLGKDPKTGKEIRILKSKSGYFIPQGLRRIYFDENNDIEKITLEEALNFLKNKKSS